ncbi:MAG: hypothetical protein AAFU38_20365, partial [Bacteroidota bacterium]
MDSPPVRDPACQEPLYARSWISEGDRDEEKNEEKKKQREEKDSTSSGSLLSSPSYLGDGVYFPKVEIVKGRELDEDWDYTSRPLPAYNLDLKVTERPERYALARADRCTGERGFSYRACLDEAMLLGHCARLLATRGRENDFDVSMCLSWFYRAVHPCVPDMRAGDVMLDYEFQVHGRGLLPPVYALLAHLAESSRVTCFPTCKLVTLTRHRGAAAWTGNADAPPRSCPGTLRMNTIGAFLCSRDHRLTPLLSRCCVPAPLRESELRPGGELLPRGDEEALLLRAYAETLGPVYEFRRIRRSPGKVVTSLGLWYFLELQTCSPNGFRRPGVSVIDGFTVAFAAESPLFHLRDEGPLVQRLESVAVVVESSSQCRTNALTDEDPEWPAPDQLVDRDRVRCMGKSHVIDKMFVRAGCRDPLDSAHGAREDSWDLLKTAAWNFRR